MIRNHMMGKQNVYAKSKPTTFSDSINKKPTAIDELLNRRINDNVDVGVDGRNDAASGRANPAEVIPKSENVEHRESAENSVESHRDGLSFASNQDGSLPWEEELSDELELCRLLDGDTSMVDFAGVFRQVPSDDFLLEPSLPRTAAQENFSHQNMTGTTRIVEAAEVCSTAAVDRGLYTLGRVHPEAHELMHTNSMVAETAGSDPTIGQVQYTRGPIDHRDTLEMTHRHHHHHRILEGSPYATPPRSRHHSIGDVEYSSVVSTPVRIKREPSEMEETEGRVVIHTPHGPALLLSPQSCPSFSMPGSIPSPKGWLGAASTPERRKFQRWSDEEDATLRQAVAIEGTPPYNWKRIARKFFINSRTGVQCKSRWTKCLQPGLIRGKWTPQEDALIKELHSDGLKWSEIAERLPGRIGEHVRERYINFLDPDLKRTPWTKEEDTILIEQQRLFGNKWTRISQKLPGRSENAIKNRWHNKKMTERRRIRRSHAETARNEYALKAQQYPESAFSCKEQDIEDPPTTPV